MPLAAHLAKAGLSLGVRFWYQLQAHICTDVYMHGYAFEDGLGTVLVLCFKPVSTSIRAALLFDFLHRA